MEFKSLLILYFSGYLNTFFLMKAVTDLMNDLPG